MSKPYAVPRSETLRDCGAPPAIRKRVDARSLLKTLAKVAFSAGMIWWILRGTDFAAIGAAVGRTHWGLLALAALVFLANILVRAARWGLLLEAYGSQASLMFLFQSCLISRFFSNLLPSTIGGDVYRAYDGCRLGQSMTRSVSILLVDRFLGVLVLMAFALAALAFGSRLADSVPHLAVWVSAGLAGVAAAVGLIFFPPAWLPRLFAGVGPAPFRKLQLVADALFELRGRRRVLAASLAWSVVLQLMLVLSGWLIAAALDLPIGPGGFFLIVPLAAVILMLPVTINGIGLRENLYVFFFAAYAVPKPDALAFSLIGYGIMVLTGIAGGVVYAVRRG